MLEPCQRRLAEQKLPENNHYPTQERNAKRKDLQEPHVVNHFAEVVLVVLELLESEDSVQERRSARLPLPHHAPKTLVANVEHHANNLVCHVERATPVDDVFVPKFESGRVLIELELAQVVAPTVVLPFDLSTEQLHKLGVTQAGPSLVLGVLTRPFNLSVLRLEWRAFHVTDRVATLALFDVQNKTVSRDEVPRLDLDNVTDIQVVPWSLQEPLVPPVEHKLLTHEFVDALAGLLNFLIVEDIYRCLGADADRRNAKNNVPTLLSVF